jgi:hypothetical protein
MLRKSQGVGAATTQPKADTEHRILSVLVFADRLLNVHIQTEAESM